MPNPAVAEVLSVAQVAEELQVDRRTVIRRINAGAIHATKLGTHTSAYVITRDELERFKAAGS